MRRKRLKHVADTLCQMFCGWRQIFSKPQLVQLGNGRLEIDALTGSCSFNGTPIDQVSVAIELRAWLEQDLMQHNIPKSALKEASVSAELLFQSVPWHPLPATQFFKSGEPIHSGPMHQCVVRCASMVRTDDAEYRSKLEDVERWPVGWPAA